MPRWKQNDLNSDTLFQKKRETVIREAAKTFSAKGYHGTSLDEVAKVLGVTKAALYYYVPSKRDILYECLLIGAGIGDDSMEEAKTGNSPGLPQVESFIRAYAQRATEDLGACLLITDMDDLEDGRKSDIRGRQGDIHQGLVGLIEEGKRTGDIAPGLDADLSARFIIHSLNTLPRWGGAPNGETATRSTIDGIASLITSGMGMAKAAE